MTGHSCDGILIERNGGKWLGPKVRYTDGWRWCNTCRVGFRQRTRCPCCRHVLRIRSRTHGVNKRKNDRIRTARIASRSGGK